MSWWAKLTLHDKLQEELPLLSITRADVIDS